MQLRLNRSANVICRRQNQFRRSLFQWRGGCRLCNRGQILGYLLTTIVVIGVLLLLQNLF